MRSLLDEYLTFLFEDDRSTSSEKIAVSVAASVGRGRDRAHRIGRLSPFLALAEAA